MKAEKTNLPRNTPAPARAASEPSARAREISPLELRHGLQAPHHARPDAILQLQRAYGNRSVSALLHTPPSPNALTVPARTPNPGAHTFQLRTPNPGQHTFQPSTPAPGALTVQARLEVSSADHPTEREADQVADQVVRQVQRPTGSSISEHPGGNRPLMRKPLAAPRAGLDGVGVSPSIEQGIRQARGGGQRIDPGIRTRMEQSFGADFSGVRVHVDAGADRLSRSLGARAMTTGSDIFFKQGAYDPGSAGGAHLLAHELTHVVQQQGSGTSVQREIDNDALTRLPYGIAKLKLKDVAQRELKGYKVDEVPDANDPDADLPTYDGTAIQGDPKSRKKLMMTGPGLTWTLKVLGKVQDPQGVPAGAYYLVNTMSDIELDHSGNPGFASDLNLLVRCDQVAEIVRGTMKSYSSAIPQGGPRSRRGKILPTDRGDPPIDKSDVLQNNVSDCYLHAALIALAGSRPTSILNLFGKDAQERRTNLETNPMEIRFPGTYYLQVRWKDVTPVTPGTIEVDDRLAFDDNDSPFYSGKKDAYLWPAFIEKAWALHRGGYGNLQTSDLQSRQIMSAITGDRYMRMLVQDFSDQKRELRAGFLWRLYRELAPRLARGEAVTFGTDTWFDEIRSRGRGTGQYKWPEKKHYQGLGAAHVYTVLELTPTNLVQPAPRRGYWSGELKPTPFPNASVKIQDPRGKKSTMDFQRFATGKIINVEFLADPSYWDDEKGLDIPFV